jgi:hypothetical protein
MSASGRYMSGVRHMGCPLLNSKVRFWPARTNRLDSGRGWAHPCITWVRLKRLAACAHLRKRDQPEDAGPSARYEKEQHVATWHKAADTGHA